MLSIVYSLAFFTSLLAVFGYSHLFFFSSFFSFSLPLWRVPPASRLPALLYAHSLRAPRCMRDLLVSVQEEST